MHDLIVSNMVFHALSTLALFVFCAATALHDPLRRREPRRHVAIAVAPQVATAAPAADLAIREHALDLDLEIAEAA
jgi:hypothetical protein